MKSFFLVLILSLSSQVKAADIWAQCLGGCDEARMRVTAQNAAPSNLVGFKMIYVTNLHSEIVNKYRVTHVYEPAQNIDMMAAWKLTAEPIIRSEYKKIARAIKQQNSEGMDIPATLVPSSYDTIHNSYNRYQLAQYVSNNLDIENKIGAVIGIPAVFFKKVMDATMKITLNFADNSEMLIELVGLDGDFSNGFSFAFKVIEGSARDANGNHIPVSDAEANNYQGNFRNTNEANDMQQFIEYWYYNSGGPTVTCESVAVQGVIIMTCRVTTT